MIPTHDNCFFAFFPCTVHTIRSMGQYESHLPNIWRINTWSKSIVKSDGNHHVCRFLLVLFVCQIVTHHLVKSENMWEFINSLLQKDMWEPKETEKKEKHIISDHSRKEPWRNTQKMTSSQVLKEAVCKGHDQPPIRLSLWWQYEHRRRTSFGGHEIHWRCINTGFKNGWWFGTCFSPFSWE